MKEKCKTIAVLMLLPVLLSAPVSAMLVGLASWIAGTLSKQDVSDTRAGNRIQACAIGSICLPLLLFHPAWTLLATLMYACGLHLLMRRGEQREEECEDLHGPSTDERTKAEVRGQFIDCSDGQLRAKDLGDGVVIDATFVRRD